MKLLHNSLGIVHIISGIGVLLPDVLTDPYGTGEQVSLKDKMFLKNTLAKTNHPQKWLLPY
jgi:hypothetical protein